MLQHWRINNPEFRELQFKTRQDMAKKAWDEQVKADEEKKRLEQVVNEEARRKEEEAKRIEAEKRKDEDLRREQQVRKTSNCLLKNERGTNSGFFVTISRWKQVFQTSGSVHILLRYLEFFGPRIC